MGFRAVILDWRGTLVTTLSEDAWVSRSLTLAGRDATPAAIHEVLTGIRAASGDQDRLEGPGVDSGAEVHRGTYVEVFADAGLDPDVASALYAVESDHRYNPFAADAVEVLGVLRDRGVRVAVLSDIHFDIRPAFTDAGMDGLVDVFTLSFEQGLQKPDPRMFTRTVDALGIGAAETVMVGDRSGPDGAAVEQGITTLLLPPLRDVEDRRLHRVLALCDTYPASQAVSTRAHSRISVTGHASPAVCACSGSPGP